MQIDAATQRALDQIAARETDVQRAFTPGAVPRFNDVASSGAAAQMSFDPLSVAPPEGAYFVASDERGRTTYTRDGCFALRDAMLTGADGRPVLGYRTAGGALTELRLDPIDAALERATNLRIEPDGALVYDRASVDPRSGTHLHERVVVGHLALARFPAATALQPVDASHGIAPPGVVPHVGRAGDGNFATMQPMRRETSTIDFNRSLERLHDAYLAFDALQAAHKAQGQVGKTTMDLLK